jgi:hypothetical protein
VIAGVVILVVKVGLFSGAKVSNVVVKSVPFNVIAGVVILVVKVGLFFF